MKRLRIISIVILSIIIMSLPVYSAEGDGLTFTADAAYRVNKAYEESPNTFEAWIKLDPGVTGRGGVIIGNYRGANPDVSFEIHENGTPRLWLTDASGKNSNYIFSDVHVNTGEWVHLAIVRDAAEGRICCYVDGKLKATKNDTYNGNPEVAVPMGIGGDLRSGNAQYFKGEIRSIAVYSDARTTTEVAADKNEYGSENLIALYDLTSSRGGRIADNSGNNYDIVYKSAWIEREDKAPASGYAYSFAVIGDTQRIAYNYKDKIGLIYDWILDNAEVNKTQFVMGLGDITDQSLDREWNLAMYNIRRMADAGIPFSLTRGNHDTVDTFNKNYSYSEFSSSVEGSFDDSMLNTWQKFSVGNRKYIVFALDFGPSDDVLSWAEEIIVAHPDHNVIITTHSYLYRDGTTLDASDLYPPTSGNTGDHMWKKLIKKHENIVLVLSGHDPVGRIITAQDKGDNGNIVTQMLVDFQYEDANQGGLGIVTVLHFSEDSDEIQVETYSTAKKQYYKPRNQFTFTLDFVGEDPIDEPSDEVEESSEIQTESETSPAPETEKIEAEESEGELITESSAKTEDKEDQNSTSSDIIKTVGIAAAIILPVTAVVLIFILKKKKK